MIKKLDFRKLAAAQKKCSGTDNSLENKELAEAGVPGVIF